MAATKSPRVVFVTSDGFHAGDLDLNDFDLTDPLARESFAKQALDLAEHTQKLEAQRQLDKERKH